MTKVKTVHCPECDKLIPWIAESKWRPFCSERCKLIDLGEWASENYKIASKENQPSLDEQTPDHLKH